MNDGAEGTKQGGKMSCSKEPESDNALAQGVELLDVPGHQVRALELFDSRENEIGVSQVCGETLASVGFWGTAENAGFMWPGRDLVENEDGL